MSSYCSNNLLSKRKGWESYRQTYSNRKPLPLRRGFDMCYTKRGVRRERYWSRYRERMARRHVPMPSSSQISPVWRGGARRGYRRYFYRSKESKYKKWLSESKNYFAFGLEDVFPTPSNTWDISIGMQAPIGFLAMIIIGWVRVWMQWLYKIFGNWLFYKLFTNVLLGVMEYKVRRGFDRDKYTFDKDKLMVVDAGCRVVLFGPEYSSDNP